VATNLANSTFSSSLESAENYQRWLARTFAPYLGRSILEIGMGHGALSEYLATNRNYIGLDIDGALVRHARTRYPDREFIEADIRGPGFVEQLAGRQTETVVCVNVLEHVADDRGAVHDMLSLVSPGGHLILFVPAFRRLYTSLDQLAGHLRRYTVHDVRVLFDAVPDRIVRLEYFNPLGAVGWWLNGLVKHSSLEAEGVTRQVRFFDRVVLPMSRGLNKATRHHFGQSVLCVVCKSS
jgi:SAM-dependent methyltransferase